MRAHERRAIGKDGYCNLDIWNPRLGCWTKTKKQYDTEEEAWQAATKPGRYRISKVEKEERIEAAPFDVE